MSDLVLQDTSDSASAAAASQIVEELAGCIRFVGMHHERRYGLRRIRIVLVWQRHNGILGEDDAASF